MPGMELLFHLSALPAPSLTHSLIPFSCLDPGRLFSYFLVTTWVQHGNRGIQGIEHRHSFSGSQPRLHRLE